jgi:hypothetical protein
MELFIFTIDMLAACTHSSVPITAPHAFECGCFLKIEFVEKMLSDSLALRSKFNYFELFLFVSKVVVVTVTLHAFKPLLHLEIIIKR